MKNRLNISPTGLTRAAVRLGLGVLACLAVAPAFAEDCAIVFCATTPNDIEAKERAMFLKYQSDATTTELMAQVFEKAGYRTVFRLGGDKATKHNLTSAFAQCKSRLKKGDRFVLYVCAHGAQQSVLYDQVLSVRDQWFCVDENGLGDGDSQVAKIFKDATEQVVKASGKKPDAWGDAESAAFVKILRAKNVGALMQSVYDREITDGYLKSSVEGLESDYCTVILESCHSGGAPTSFVDKGGTRSLSYLAGDANEVGHFDLPRPYCPIPNPPMTRSLVDLLGGSSTRALAGDTVVVASVQGEEPAQAPRFPRDLYEKLGLGTDWIPPGQELMVGLFTVDLIAKWADEKYEDVTWGSLMAGVRSDLESVSAKGEFKDESGKAYVQVPQMEARHADKSVLFLSQRAGGPATIPGSDTKPANPPAQPSNPPAAPSNPAKPQAPARPTSATEVRGNTKQFHDGYMDFHNPDEGTVRIQMEPNSGRVPAGTSLRFSLDVGQAGYVFLVDEDSDGHVQLLPWSNVAPTKDAASLVRDAKCDAATGLNVGGGRFSFTTKDVGHEHLKVLFFRDQKQAMEFAQAWLNLRPETLSQSRSLNSRSLIVQDNGAATVFTADLVFEVTGE